MCSAAIAINEPKTNESAWNTIDRYQIEREIGRGGMSTVFLADDPRHKRQVAIKVMRSELASAASLERFDAEIQLTARLQHPGILPMFDSGEIDGLPYYVMPYVSGETLRQRLDREGPLPVEEAVAVAVSLADALAHAHERGVVHRDLKPENILLDGRRPILADFGIASSSETACARTTHAGVSLGTPQYMSPEQAAGEESVDARSDIYSLGAILYEMLSGEPAHDGPTPRAIMARIIAEDPRPLRHLRRAVPRALAEAVHRALAKLPADRFATAGEFARVIDAVITRSRRRVGRLSWRLLRAAVVAGMIAGTAAIAAAGR